MTDEAYGQSKTHKAEESDAPQLDYLPSRTDYRPKIGLIGAGGITEYHLRAYKKHGLDVVSIANPTLSKAEQRRDEYYPDAQVTTDPFEIFARDDIEVVDIATHPAERVRLIEQAIDAGKHILSQKPFVTDLDVGQRLVDLAEAKGVRLAVNQNGRWAPHYRYIAQAIRHGIVGDVGSIDFSQQWDHTWTAGTAFENVHHLLLYDFGVHWFDFANCFTGSQRAERIYASVRCPSYQKVRPPFLANCIIDYPTTQVRINYNAHVRFGQQDCVVVCGETGTIRSAGESLNVHSLQLDTEGKCARPDLKENGSPMDSKAPCSNCSTPSSMTEFRKTTHAIISKASLSVSPPSVAPIPVIPRYQDPCVAWIRRRLRTTFLGKRSHMAQTAILN